MMKCKVCGKSSQSEYCFQHKPRKPLARTSASKRKEAGVKANQMHTFFLDIWKTRRHYSELSNTYLGKEPLSIFFHHILPKEKYPQAAFDEENIILLTLDEHTNVESSMYRYPAINEKREKLLLKYEKSISDHC